MRVVSATGVGGSGFSEASLARGMSLAPHFIGCDAGSTDPGPFSPGAGESAFPRRAMKRDRLPQALAFKASIPHPRFQSDLLDSDNHGGQQYGPLMDIEIPEFQSRPALCSHCSDCHDDAR